VDPVPDPLQLRKSGSAGNRTRDLCVSSQSAWLILRPWRWTRSVPPKDRLTFNGPHGGIRRAEDRALHNCLQFPCWSCRQSEAMKGFSCYCALYCIVYALLCSLFSCLTEVYPAGWSWKLISQKRTNHNRNSGICKYNALRYPSRTSINRFIYYTIKSLMTE
jgi:hypothetical protein